MKPTILCIEDHPDNMMLIRRIFRPDSYNLIAAGCTLYMSKPINIVELSEKVDALVDQQKQRDTT